MKPTSYHIVCTLLAGMAASGAQANDIALYCDSLYPVDSYPGEERSLYVQECINSYQITDYGNQESQYIDDSQGYQDEAVSSDNSSLD